eukprot:523414_1
MQLFLFVFIFAFLVFIILAIVIILCLIRRSKRLQRKNEEQLKIEIGSQSPSQINKQLEMIKIENDENKEDRTPSTNIKNIGINGSKDLTQLTDVIITNEMEIIQRFETNGSDSSNNDKSEQMIHELESWLMSIGLQQYFTILVKNGYESISFIKEIHNVELLQEIGINDKQHQQILMDAIGENDTEEKETDSNVLQFWLNSMNLCKYIDNFTKNEYKTIESVVDINGKEELKQMGIIKKVDLNRLFVHIQKLQEMKYWLDSICLTQYLKMFVLSGYQSLELIKEINEICELHSIGIENQHLNRLFTEISLFAVEHEGGQNVQSDGKNEGDQQTTK